ncbi:MAG: hypothetical protein KAX11_08095, partial [Candidatus Aminicenantes bacterium]|nr:hypothetical protein [Candidatus Aminicenantes bacterium]
ELSKLTKIKQLLGDQNDIEPQEPPVPEKIEPQAYYEIVEESTPQIDVEKLTVEENVLSNLQSLNEMKTDTNFEQLFEFLEKYRKGSCTEDNGDVSYFKKNNRIIIDGECLISTLANSLTGAKKLYKQLSKTESPKEQFFIKQDIIRYQEVLRKLMLVAIRMCEKEACSLPKYTMEILNVDILKSILEKVSMENWSDQEDFSSFDEYAKSLKDSYYEKITPPAQYLDSIINELETS